MEFGTVLLCLALLEQRHTAESEGRLDFTVVLEATTRDEGIDLTPKVHMGSPYSVGRISFTGHNRINDSTLRRAITLQERGLFDVGQLRRSLDRLNETGLVEPLTLADVVISRRADGATADVTIPLRERDRRWWQLSGPIIPGFGSYHALLSFPLPWRILGVSTSYVTVDLLRLAKPLQGVLRPTIAHYGRTHVSRLLHATLGETRTESLTVPITGESRLSGELLVCDPPKPKLPWLKRGVLQAADVALAFVLP